VASRTPFASLQHRDYRVFWVGQALSTEVSSPEFSAAAGGVAALAIVVGLAIAVPAVRRYEIPSLAHEDHGVAGPRAHA
jgi:hypothetical protein